MRNLKKTLAVVLAFAMILSMGLTSMAAYSDVEAGTVVSEAVGILSNLNILTGFEDGTFKPEETVTRAQMAAIICRMLGYEDQAQSSKGSTIFNDVAADHWASGYINVAQAQQIINGYGDGNYGPEDLVTYEQAVKMIVSALGYDLAANAKGGYPTGYLAIASAEGITKKANGRVGDPAARGTIAVLVYNSLEVNLFEQGVWTTTGEDDEYGYDDENILTKYLDIQKWEGVVTTTPASGVAGGTYDATATPKVALSDAYKWAFDDLDYERAENTSTFPTTRADKVDVNPYLGKNVILYVGEDSLTGEDTVFAITENRDKNSSLKISVTQLVGDKEKYYDDEAYVVGYKEVGSSKVKDITIQKEITKDKKVVQSDAAVYRNFNDSLGLLAPTTGTGFHTKEIAKVAGAAGVIEFISNDGDDEYEVILVTSYDREAVIETIEERNGEYTFDTYRGKLPKVDTEDEDQLVIVYKDGVAATVADLAANDTVSYVEVATGFEIYYVSSATVSGTVEAYDTTNKVVTIAGTDYEVSPKLGKTVDKLSGEEGIFFLNVDGQIAWNETNPTATGKYALVTAIYEESSGVDTGWFVQTVLADGSIAEYKIADRAEVITSEKGDVKAVKAANGLKDNALTKVTVDDVIDTDEEFAAYFAEKMTAPSDKNTWKAHADKNIEKLVVKLTVSNDKVTRATQLPEYGVDADGKYDVDAKSVGNYDLDDNTVVFSIKEKKGEIDVDNIKVGSIADFMIDGETIDGIAYDEDDSSATYGAYVGFGIDKPIDATSNVFVVTSRKTTTIDTDDAYVLTGICAGEEMTITVYNEDGYSGQKPDGLVAGDVILISEPDAEGIVSDIEKLVDFDKETTSMSITTTTGADDENDIYSGYGIVTAAKDNKFYISGDITNDYKGALKVAATAGVSYKEYGNYTLVDYTENFKNPEISVEDGSDYFIDPAYTTYAYVRYVDGKLADVVAYRMAKVKTLAVIAETDDADKLDKAENITLAFYSNLPGADIKIKNDVAANGGGSATVSYTVDGNTVVITGGSAAANDTLAFDVEVKADDFTTVTESFLYTFE